MRDRFFVPGLYAVGDMVSLDRADARKIETVLRKRTGDAIEVVDSAANAFVGELDIAKGAVRATLREMLGRNDAVSSLRVTVAQGIPKGQKMDFVVEKLTELGVHAIVPLQSERSVVTGISASKLERWRRLAKSAAQQCGRRDVPTVAPPVHVDALLKTFGSYDLVLLPWELAHKPLREALPALLEGKRSVLAVIGPEGGFSRPEAERAQAGGAYLVSLGRRILRTETAGLVLLAILDFLA